MISIHLTDEQLPALAKLIADSPQLAELVAGHIRKRKDSYTVTELAKALNVCPRTVKNHIKAKIIPTIPGVKPTRIPASYMENLKTKTTH